MEVALSRNELKRLEQYALEQGLSLEDALKHAVVAEMDRRYRLPASQGRVVPFQGLKSGEKSTE